MGGRADSPPDVNRGASKKPGSGTATLELVEADVEPPSAADDLGLVPGTVLADKYLIERQIGRGGIGVIVAANHLQLDQRVAIKYLQKKVLGNRSIIERFAREARLAAKIRSDHVVRVHDVAADPDLGPFIVMEYLEGNDLGQMLESGPLPIADAVDYVLQACDALAEAHSLGIVHRDLKPDNLFLARRPAGRSIVKILDFGISKAAPAQRGAGGWSHVTTANETFGTPVYMSPEQLRSSASVDARSDIWALGVVLFELLTREVPFSGDSVAQLCTSILSDPPRALRSLRREAPPELEATLQRCLRKDPGQRFRNVAELAQELAPFGREGSEARVEHIKRGVEEGGASVRPPGSVPASSASKEVTLLSTHASVPGLPKRYSSGVVASAAAGALFAIVVLVAVLSRRPRTAPDPTPTTTAAAAATPTSNANPNPISNPTEVPTPNATPTATSTPAATSKPSPTSAWTAVTTTPARSTAKPSPAAAVPRVKATASPPSSPSSPPVATAIPAAPSKPTHQDDYTQFGERP